MKSAAHGQRNDDLVHPSHADADVCHTPSAAQDRWPDGSADECPKCGFLHAYDRSCEDRTPSAAYTAGDRVRFREDAPDGDELTFEGVVSEVVAGNGTVRLLIDTPLGRRLRTQDEVEPARRGRRA